MGRDSLKKYNLVFNTDIKSINISTDIEIDEHLKRHLKQMIDNNKNGEYIMKWLHNRGISNEVDTDPLIRS